MAATIRDAARKAGINISTASIVLNGKPNMSEETQQKMLKATEELNYHPHIVSASEWHIWEERYEYTRKRQIYTTRTGRKTS